MEKQLLDAIKNGTLDEISTAMIAARVKVASQELDKLMHDTAEKLFKLYEQYQAEYRISGSTVILYYKDKLFEVIHPGDDQFEVEVVNGRGKYVSQAREALNKMEVHK